jgi:hypothetical protein
MWILLKMSVYFASIFLLGFSLLSVFSGSVKRSKLLQIALAFGLGSSGVSVSLFIYFFLWRGHDSVWLGFSLWALILVFAVFTALRWHFKCQQLGGDLSRSLSGLGGYIRNYWSALGRSWRAWKIWQRILLAVVSVLLVGNSIALISDVAVRPAAQLDSITMWAYKAKTLYYQGHIDFNPQSLSYLGGGGHLNYPWQIPLQEFWLDKHLGVYNDLLTNWIFLFYFLALLVVVFTTLRKHISGFRAVIFSFFLFSLPLVFYHSFNAYADLPLTFYVVAATALFYSWLQTGQRSDLLLSVIFWGLSFWVKDTALIFFMAWLASSLVYSWHTVPGRRLSWCWLIPLALAAPWYVFRHIYGQGLANVEGGMVFKPEILWSFYDTLFVSYSWNIWWVIVIISGFSHYQRIRSNRELAFIWWLLGFSLVAWVGVFLFTPDWRYAVDQTALSRCLLGVAGISVLAVGLSFCEKA